ncbi:TetR/AcrR family transcriptional regulator [Kribbella sp. NBC_01510]|uniref:TetR/AcrR family transcriptional regulator n=1 Tax=Kribbella sp. NBC_01510 TaxID=2903581 RepID=UPI00386B4CAD
MTAPDAKRHPPYHHGDLHRALVEAGTELAREGGPSAIVLREAARRVGVSPNAAYRHFSALPELVEAVAFDALSALARSMEAELAKCRPSGEPGRDAIDRLGAVGRGYVQFALSEPGLFAAAFAPSKTTAHAEDAPVRPGDDADHSGDEARGVGDSGLMPGELLEQALDGMVDARVLDAADRDTAALNAWAAVHGLSELLLGPMAGQAPSARGPLIDAFLDLVGRGLITRRTIESGQTDRADEQ